MQFWNMVKISLFLCIWNDMLSFLCTISRVRKQYTRAKDVFFSKVKCKRKAKILLVYIKKLVGCYIKILGMTNSKVWLPLVWMVLQLGKYQWFNLCYLCISKTGLWEKVGNKWILYGNLRTGDLKCMLHILNSPTQWLLF